MEKDRTQTPEMIIQRLGRTTEEIFSLKELRALLASGRPLRIKYGVDVTAPFLHIGHAVNLWMMRALQDQGHKVIFLIGDFTTRIGDPTGRNKTRPVIEQAEIERNTTAFIEQVKMVLRSDDPELFEVRRNSEWYGSMPVSQFLGLLSMVTHGRLMTREMFQRRLGAGEDIYMHELIYPILQGYDSVALQADLTIIGSDQLFNEMQGRMYQEKFGQTQQVIITSQITPGIDGGAKQSKSLGNYIGLGHSPREKFGRVMSIPDHLIEQYFRVYTEEPLEGVDVLTANDPFEAKKRLAVAITARYHGAEVAAAEREWFEKTFSRRTPSEMPELVLVDASIDPVELVRLVIPGKTRSAAKRMVTDGALKVNDRKHDTTSTITLATGDTVRVGKLSWATIRIGE